MTKDEAMKLALEALEWSWGGEPMGTKEIEAITALRAALEQPSDSVEHGWYDVEDISDYEEGYRAGYIEGFKAGVEIVQPEQKPVNHIPDTTKMIDNVRIRYWVQDTVESGRWVTIDSMSPSTAETLLSDEYRGAFPQGHIVEPPNSTTDVVESEPVAKVDMTKKGHIAWLLARRELQQDQFLYTAPPSKPWVSLTDEEIVKASIGHVEGEHMLPHSFARAIEAKLKEKNRG